MRLRSHCFCSALLLLLPLVATLGAAGLALAGPGPVRIGPDDLHFAWASGGGPSEAYRVRVSRDGGPFLPEQVVSRTEAWVAASEGETIAIAVSAIDGAGRQSAVSAASPTVQVLSPGGDADSDGAANEFDPCPFNGNDGWDGDADGIPDACDSCPGVADSRGLDTDGDGVGDACDPDIDGDGSPNAADLCPSLALPAFWDSDGDGVGDPCDPCNTFAWTDPPTNPPDQNPKAAAVLFKSLNTPDSQAIRVAGKFKNGYFTTFVDPSFTGLSFRVEDEDGLIYAIGIPPGLVGSSPCDERDGWSLTISSGNPVWRYTNVSGSLDPMTCEPAAAKLATAVVRDKQATKGWVECVIDFKKLKLDHVPTLPARSVLAAVTLSDHTSRWEPGWAARSSSCGEAFFESPPDSGTSKPFCKPTFSSGQLSKIICRGP